MRPSDQVFFSKPFTESAKDVSQAGFGGEWVVVAIVQFIGQRDQTPFEGGHGRELSINGFNFGPKNGFRVTKGSEHSEDFALARGLVAQAFQLGIDQGALGIECPLQSRLLTGPFFLETGQATVVNVLAIGELAFKYLAICLYQATFPVRAPVP